MTGHKKALTKTEQKGALPLAPPRLQRWRGARDPQGTKTKPESKNRKNTAQAMT
jgi:hypothetical protein